MFGEIFLGGIFMDYSQLTQGEQVTYLVICIIMAVISIVALWKIFTKAGEKGWKAIIPIYDLYIMFKITWGNGWFFLLMIIPFVNIVIGIITLWKLAKVFGKGVGFFFGLLFLEPIFLLILAFGSAEYVGIQGSQTV